MEFNRKQYSSILKALRASPRGMNVTEVAKATGMNRATVAKYLEMLYVTGHADMRTFGTSKVYYISQRMPISAFLSFSSDLIIVLDKDLRVLNANDSFFEFTNTGREDVVHKNITNFAFPLKFDPPIDARIMQAIEGNGTTIESYYRKGDRGYYFNVKLIPLVFDEGEKGVTIIFEDITEKKFAEKALRDSNRELERKVRERTLELEKANEALRKSEAHLTEAQQIAHVGYWSVNLKTGDITASDETYRIFGIEPGTKWNYEAYKARIHPDYAPLVENTDNEAIFNGKPIDFEYKLAMPDGYERIVHSKGEVRRDGSGKAVEIFGAIQDVTGRKRAEEALRKTEDKYRALVENINDIAWEMDKDSRFTYASPQVRDIVGNGPEYYLGRSILEFMPPEDLPGFIGGFRDYFVNPRPFSLTRIRMFHRDGGVLELEINGTPYYDEKGKFCGYRGVTRNVTSRELARKALCDSEERYRKLIEDIEVMIWEIDENYICTYMSPRSREVLGYEPGELIGRKPFDYMAPDEAKRIMEQLKPLLDAHKPFELVDYYVFRKDGARVFFKTNAMPIFGENREFKGYRGVNRDITNGRM